MISILLSLIYPLANLVAVIIQKRSQKALRVIYGSRFLRAMTAGWMIQSGTMIIVIPMLLLINRRRLLSTMHSATRFSDWAWLIQFASMPVGSLLGTLILFVLLFSRYRTRIICSGIPGEELSNALKSALPDALNPKAWLYTVNDVAINVKEWKAKQFYLIQFKGRDRDKINEMHERVIAALKPFERDVAKAIRFSLRTLLLAVVAAGALLSVAVKSEPWQEQHTWTSRADASVVAISFDSQTVVTGGKDGAIRVWKTTAEVPQAEFKGSSTAIISIACSSDGGQIVNASQDGEICTWNVATLSKALALTPSAALSVSWSLDGTHIAGAGTDGIIRVWNSETGVLENQRAEPKTVLVNFLANEWVALFSDKDVEKIWDLKSGKVTEINFSAYWFKSDLQNFNGYHHLLKRQGPNMCLTAKHFGFETAQDFGPALKASYSDEKHLVATYPDGRIILWKQIYPEKWWGIVCLREVWVALIFSFALSVSIVLENRTRNRNLSNTMTAKETK